MTRRRATVFRPLVTPYAAPSAAESAKVQACPGHWSGRRRCPDKAEVPAQRRRKSTLIAATRTVRRQAPRVLIVTAALLVLGNQGAGGARASTLGPARSWAGVFESSLVDRINAFRRAHHLGALELSGSLSAAAREHDEQMIRFGYFGHASPDGSSFWQRVESHYRSQPRHSWAVGENLLSASPRVSPGGALAAWLASPEHRATLLNADWREIGLDVLHVRSAPGVFAGEPTTVITADFGVRS